MDGNSLSRPQPKAVLPQFLIGHHVGVVSENVWCMRNIKSTTKVVAVPCSFIWFLYVGLV